MQETLENENRTSPSKQTKTTYATNLVLPVKIVGLYPGETGTIPITIKGIHQLIEIKVKGPPGPIRTTVSPKTGYTPLSVNLTISVDEKAEEGFYNMEILVTNTEGYILAKDKLLIIVLNRKIDKKALKRLPDMIKITKRLGIQGLFWYILEYVYPEGARFGQIHALHKLVSQREVSVGTTGNILKSMIKKKIIEKEDGIYKSLIHSVGILKTRIDSSRIRLREYNKRARSDSRSPITEPNQVYWTFYRAQKIRDKHGPLTAMYFLVYTLVGARQTGFLLYWNYDWFIYCEKKTGFCHHFTSSLLEQYFKRLGLEPGVMYSKTSEHEKARKQAEKYIKQYYRSFRVARRLHYLLKEKGLITYEDQDVYTLELLYYPDGEVGVRIWDAQERELIEEINIREEQPASIEKRSAFPEEHIYAPNEETYFHRPI